MKDVKCTNCGKNIESYLVGIDDEEALCEDCFLVDPVMSKLLQILDSEDHEVFQKANDLGRGLIH